MTNQAKVGIFSTATVAIFIFGFYFLKGSNLFDRSNTYYAVYHRVDGLYKSNLIEINGFPVGKVGNMERNPETGVIVVQLDLETGLKVPRNASAQLISTDVFGTKKIKLLFDQSSHEFLKEGDTLTASFKVDLTETLGAQFETLDMTKLQASVDSTLYAIRFAVRRLFDENNPRGIYTTLDEANDLIRSNKANLQATLNNLKLISENLEKNSGKINNIVGNISSFSDSLQQANIKQTIQNLNGTITQLNGVVGDINQGKGSLGKLIKQDGLYANIDSTISSLDKLAKDIKARPYRYISINVLGAKKAEARREKKFNESGK